MRELTDMGARVIAAMVVGAALVGVAMVGSHLLPPGGLPDALGGWPLLAELAALLCGVCALAMSVTLSWRWRHAARLVIATLAVSALAWGICLSAATSSAGWARALAGWPWLADTITPLAAVGASLISWLLLYAALAGLLAGAWPDTTSAARRALTPLWLTPVWGAGVGVTYGLLFAFVFSTPPCPPYMHCYGLDTTRWDGLRVGLAMGIGAGLIVGVTLTLALRLALALRPIRARAQPAYPV